MGAFTLTFINPSFYLKAIVCVANFQNEVIDVALFPSLAICALRPCLEIVSCC